MNALGLCCCIWKHLFFSLFRTRTTNSAHVLHSSSSLKNNTFDGILLIHFKNVHQFYELLPWTQIDRVDSVYVCCLENSSISLAIDHLTHQFSILCCFVFLLFITQKKKNIHWENWWRERANKKLIVLCWRIAKLSKKQALLTTNDERKLRQQWCAGVCSVCENRTAFSRTLFAFISISRVTSDGVYGSVRAVSGANSKWENAEIVRWMAPLVGQTLSVKVELCSSYWKIQICMPKYPGGIYLKNLERTCVVDRRQCNGFVKRFHMLYSRLIHKHWRLESMLSIHCLVWRSCIFVIVKMHWIATNIEHGTLDTEGGVSLMTLPMVITSKK